VQASAEGAAFTRAEFDRMHDLAVQGIETLVAAQKAAVA
jgi:ribonuclease PH